MCKNFVLSCICIEYVNFLKITYYDNPNQNKCVIELIDIKPVVSIRPVNYFTTIMRNP